jgi:hypothetical protein
MIFNWFKQRKTELSEQKPTWEYAEEPVYNKEHRETMEIIQDILDKLDEIKELIGEVKEGDQKK